MRRLSPYASDVGLSVQEQRAAGRRGGDARIPAGSSGICYLRAQVGVLVRVRWRGICQGVHQLTYADVHSRGTPASNHGAPSSDAPVN